MANRSARRFCGAGRRFRRGYGRPPSSAQHDHRSGAFRRKEDAVTESMRRVRWVLVAVACLVAAAISLPAAAAHAGPIASGTGGCGRSAAGTGAETALLSRAIGGAAARQICIQVDPAAGGADTFTI